MAVKVYAAVAAHAVGMPGAKIAFTAPASTPAILQDVRSLLVLAIVLRLLGLLGVVGCYRHTWGSLIVIHWRRAHVSIAIGALRIFANMLEL